jgi:tetratricopeptide (TPR) repeat protein
MAQEARTSTGESAGRLLHAYWESAELDTPEELADDAVEVRARYAGLLERDSDVVANAVGLVVLAAATLRAHVTEEYADHSRFQWADNLEPFPGLGSDDEYGHTLADEVTRAARRALELDSSNNLAAFALGYALEWLGEHDAATKAYREAVRLDPHDEPARVRVAALDDVVSSRQQERVVSSHAHGFCLLEMTHLVNNTGDSVGWTWLLTDLAEVRGAAEEYLAEWLPGFNPDRAELSTFSLEVYQSGRAPVYLDLTTFVHSGPDGAHTIDWPSATVPAAVDAPLPPAQPIRQDGEVRFFGPTEHWV